MSEMTTAALVWALHGVRDQTHGECDRTVVWAAQRLEALQAENERLTKELAKAKREREQLVKAVTYEHEERLKTEAGLAKLKAWCDGMGHHGMTVDEWGSGYGEAARDVRQQIAAIESAMSELESTEDA